MRALCLDLHQDYNDNIAENFLSFSSRIKFRKPGLLFADVTDSVLSFGSEQALLKELNQYNKDFFPEAQAAIASTPFKAQLFTRSRDDYFTCSPNEEKDVIDELPLTHLHNLEGLVPWSSQEEVEDIITFFKVLGFDSIGDIQSFGRDSFHQRWGKTGELMWKRLHDQERQLICPIRNNQSYVDNIELSYPISLKPYLLHCLEKYCRKLMNQVKSANNEAYKAVVYLHCEYNYDVHLIEVHPQESYLNLMNVFEQLERKLSDLDLSNPIKKIDIEFFASKPFGKKFFSWHKQYFKNRTREQMSLATFDQVLSGQMSRQSFEDVHTDWIQVEGLDEIPQSMRVGDQQLKFSLESSGFDSKLSTEIFETALEIDDIGQFQRLSPVEGVFYGLSDIEGERGREYFVAIDPNQQKVCICWDRLEQKYYLKGRLN